MRRAGFGAILGLLAALLPMPALAAAAPPPAPAAGNPTIVVGVIASLSGPGAMAGQDSLDGFAIALKQMGGRFANQEVRLVAVDDRGSPDMALQVTRRLLEREKLDFVLTSVSTASLTAIIKPLLDSRLFVINLDNVPLRLLGADCHPSFFQMGTPAEAVNEAAGLYFATEKMRRLVLVGPDAPATDAALSGIRRYWGTDAVEVIRVRHGAVSFKAELARLRQQAPDAVYSVLSGGMGVAFIRDFAAAGLKGEIPLLAPWTSSERPLLPGMAEAGMDLLSVGPWSPDLDSPPNRRMIADFELEYGRPISAWAAQGYDAAQLLESTMRGTSGRTTDREAMRRGLRRADFASVRGGFRFDTNHAPVIPLYLRRATRDGKGRPTEELRVPLIREWHAQEVAQCPMRWVDEPPPAAAGAPKPAGQPPSSPQGAASAKAKPKPPVH